MVVTSLTLIYIVVSYLLWVFNTLPPLSSLDSFYYCLLYFSGTPVSRPLPLLIRQSSTQHPGLILGAHLFPHQKRTVQWMLDVEAEQVPPLFVPQAMLFGEWYVYCHGFKKTMFHETVDVIVPYNHQLALWPILSVQARQSLLLS